MRSSRQEVTMEKHKAKAIQADLGIFRHNQTYSGIIQTYSKSCVVLAYSEPSYIQNSGIFRIRGILRTLAYLKTWHIQNLTQFRNLAYLEPWHIQNQKHIQNPDIPRNLSSIDDGAFWENS